MSKNNETQQCFYDGHNMLNAMTIRQHFCNECGAPGKLVMRPARVLKNCHIHGDPLVEVRQVCSERNAWRNRLRRAFMIGYSHMDERAVDLHKDLVHKIKFTRAK